MNDRKHIVGNAIPQSSARFCPALFYIPSGTTQQYKCRKWADLLFIFHSISLQIAVGKTGARRRACWRSHSENRHLTPYRSFLMERSIVERRFLIRAPCGASSMDACLIKGKVFSRQTFHQHTGCKKSHENA